MTARLLNQSALGVMGWAVPLVVAVVTTRYIIHGLGHDGYAVYAWAAAFAAVISTANPARGVLHLVSRSGVAQLRQEAIATGLWTTVALGTLLTAVVWVFASAAAAGAQMPGALAIPVLRIAAIGAVPAAAMAVCVAALQGLKKFGAAATLTSIAAAITAVGSAWIATHAWGVVAVVSWQATGALIVSLATALVLRREVGPVWGAPTRTTAAREAQFSLATIGTQVAFGAWIIVERTLVSRYLGPQVLTALLVGLLMWTHANGAIGSAVQVVASLAPDGGTDSDERLVRAYASATAMTAIAAVAFTALIAGLGVPAVTLWIDHDTASIAQPLLLPLALGMGLNSLGATAWFANEAEGRPARNLVWAGLGLVLTTITLLWFAPGGHVVTAGIARLVAVAPVPFLIAWTEASSGGRLRGPWLRIVTYVIPCGVLLFAGLRTVAVVAATSWVVLIAAATIGLALYAAVVWWLPVLTERDRQALRTWIRGFSRP